MLLIVLLLFWSEVWIKISIDKNTSSQTRTHLASPSRRNHSVLYASGRVSSALLFWSFRRSDVENADFFMLSVILAPQLLPLSSCAPLWFLLLWYSRYCKFSSSRNSISSSSRDVCWVVICCGCNYWPPPALMLAREDDPKGIDVIALNFPRTHRLRLVQERSKHYRPSRISFVAQLVVCYLWSHLFLLC